MYRFEIIPVLSLCFILSGCSARQESGPVLDGPVSVTESSQEELQSEPDSQEVAQVSGGESKADVLTLTSMGTFEIPFPERVELFVAPKRQGRGVEKSSDGNESAVELLGFVNVNGQRVVLSIDGIVSPLAEGSQEAGVEVISIQPPVAVLQRGRQRWQVSLAN